MIYTLTCKNGKEIDMTSYIIQQMEGEITRQDVLDRIEYYKNTNQTRILTDNINECEN
tara:strand:- start:1019 stop:1192 length:174 start_codon:yes stop_codon:yes gene_type:complete